MHKYANPAGYGRVDASDWRSYPDNYTQVLWPAKLPSKPSDFGSNDFHGRTHPEIGVVALERYTKPGELVWDVFAGSGTIADVCRDAGNYCISTDINPVRDDIARVDARTWCPNRGVQMAFLHPPYLDIVKYGPEPGLTTGNLDEFKRGMGKVIKNVDAVLDPGRVVVLIAGQVYKDKRVVMLDTELHPMFDVRGYRLLGRIIRDFGETKGGDTAGQKNENLWKYRRLKYGLWSLAFDVVLFYQKPSEPN